MEKEGNLRCRASQPQGTVIHGYITGVKGASLGVGGTVGSTSQKFQLHKEKVELQNQLKKRKSGCWFFLCGY